MQSRNSVIAVCTPWTVVWMSLLMLVIETFMLDPAKLATNCVRASGSSIRRSATSALVAGVGLPRTAGIARDHNTPVTLKGRLQDCVPAAVVAGRVRS
jgi:hypothetical protein